MIQTNTDKVEANSMYIAKENTSASEYQSFPFKLYQLLSDPEKQEFIAWKEHGLAFEILQPKRLVKEILPVVFNQHRWTSFQRQLNIYGFRRVRKGRDMNAYFHPMFQRDRRDLLLKIRRVPVKGKEHTLRGSSEEDYTSYLVEQGFSRFAFSVATDQISEDSPSNTQSSLDSAPSSHWPVIPPQQLIFQYPQCDLIAKYASLAPYYASHYYHAAAFSIPSPQFPTLPATSTHNTQNTDTRNNSSESCESVQNEGYDEEFFSLISEFLKEEQEEDNAVLFQQYNQCYRIETRNNE